MTRPSDDMTAPFLKDRPAPVGPMFNAFRAARSIKMPRWAVPLLIGATLFHAVLFLTMWVRSIWDVEQLEKSRSALADLAIAPAPPPPPPPPPSGVRPQVPQLTPIKRRVRDLVQPVRLEEKPPVVADERRDTDVECDPAVETCSDGPGEKGGVIGQPPAPPAPPPPPPPPPAIKIVPRTMLDGQRIKGDPIIYPDDITKQQIKSSGAAKLVGSFKLCLTAAGTVASVTTIRSTAFAAYDAKIQREMHGWVYRPYLAGDTAIPVCTVITFVYSQPL